MAKKSIVKNYIYNLIYQILVMIIPLVTTPYLSKVLGADNIGRYSYTVSIVTYFILFGSLGIAMYGQREIAYLQNDKLERSKTFFEIFFLRLLTMLVSGIMFYVSFCITGEFKVYYRILILEMVANCIDISWFFQGLEEFKKTVVRSTIVKIFGVVCIFAFIKESNDLVKYFVIYVMSNFIGNLSLWIYLPKFITKIKIKELNILRHFKSVVDLFIPQIAIQVYTVMDKTMIGYILNDMIEVGNYEQSQKIIKVALTVVTSLGTVVSPRIANIASQNKYDELEQHLSKSFNFVWFIGIPIMFGIMAIADNLVPWFLGDGFEKSKTLLVVGAPLIIAIGLNNVSGVQYLIQTKKQNIFTKSVLIGAVFNFVFNLCFIGIIKSIGAIIASVLAETLILIFQLISIRKEINLKIVYKNSLKYIVSGLIMFVCIFWIGNFMQANIWTTVFQIIVGVSIYCVLLIILKDKFLISNVKNIKTKVLGVK